ncbi:MAG: hypothetical protein C0392_13370 [Syntrophus sp. (in: bacteria)]|nr:hypothetical protein [Syntrophus sp. (in: bacteria)]
MKKHCFCFIAFIIVSMVSAASGASNDADPLVSTDWLQKNMNNPSVIILDVRKVEEYNKGHIPDSINLTYAAWRTKEKNLDCQLPEKDDLNDILCWAGLRKYAFVVIVGKTDTGRDCVNMTRVAWTLKYAGIKKPLILNGGYNKWLQEKRPVSDVVKKPVKDYLPCEWNEKVLATKQQVRARMGKAAIIDARHFNLFTGKKSDPLLKRKGHIPGAYNLPYSLVFTKEGCFEKKDILQDKVSKTIGNNKAREIIVLCCNGRFASSWWFVLSEMLGYKDVKIYDGSMEEWCDDKDAPLVEGETRAP